MSDTTRLECDSPLPPSLGTKNMPVLFWCVSLLGSPQCRVPSRLSFLLFSDEYGPIWPHQMFMIPVTGMQMLKLPEMGMRQLQLTLNSTTHHYFAPRKQGDPWANQEVRPLLRKCCMDDDAGGGGGNRWSGGMYEPIAPPPPTPQDFGCNWNAITPPEGSRLGNGFRNNATASDHVRHNARHSGLQSPCSFSRPWLASQWAAVAWYMTDLRGLSTS